MLSGRMLSDAGAAPWLHWSIAPCKTSVFPTVFLPLSSRRRVMAPRARRSLARRPRRAPVTRAELERGGDVDPQVVDRVQVLERRAADTVGELRELLAAALRLL